MNRIRLLFFSGLLAASLFAVGCESKKSNQPLSEDLQQGAESAKEGVQHGSEEVKEGVGGSGAGKDGDIGKNPGVLDDDEGPIEENKKSG